MLAGDAFLYYDKHVMEDASIFEIATTTNGQTFQFYVTPIRNGGTFTVDWGDGTIENYTATIQQLISHVYTTAGTYRIKITGQYHHFSQAGTPALVTMAIQLQSTATSCSRMFEGCQNLHTIAKTFIIHDAVTDCSHMFRECRSLIEIPETLKIGIKVQSTASMFLRCVALTRIPVTISPLNAVYNCLSMFYGCTGVIAIDDGFAIGNLVTYCSSMFQGCNKMPKIPSTLTLGNLVIDCSLMFAECINLPVIPETLFPVNGFTSTGTINMSSMFSRNAIQTGKPTGTIPADKLWNSGKTFNSTQCFRNCTSLDNYADIPTDWK